MDLKKPYLKSFLFGTVMFVLLTSMFITPNLHGIQSDGMDNRFDCDVLNKTNAPRSGSGNYNINETYHGNGTSLEYVIHANGSGSRENHTYLEENAFGVNRTTHSISLPENSYVTFINFTLTDLDYDIKRVNVVNDSTVLSPNYTIDYTAIASIPNNETLNWINISAYSDPAAPLGDINITIDGNFNKTFHGPGLYNYSVSFNDTLSHNVSIEFFYESDNSLFRAENFTMRRANLPHLDLRVISPPSTYINPYIRLNSDYNNITDDVVAFKFLSDKKANLTEIEVFGKYNLYWDIHTIYNLSVSICNATEGTEDRPDLNETLGTISFNGGDVNTLNNPAWISFDFSALNIMLENNTPYYLVLNATEIISHANEIYFDLYVTNRYNDTSQRGQYINASGVWDDMNPMNASLMRYTTHEYKPADFTEIQMNITLFNETLGETVKTIDPSTNSTAFNSSIDNGGPWGMNNNFINVRFESNLTCRFRYSYKLFINQIKYSDPCNFTARFDRYNVEWQTGIRAEVPEVSDNSTVYDNSTYYYYVYFPDNWYNLNGSAPVNNFTYGGNENYLFINSSVASLNWTFRAMSDYENVLIETIPENRADFSPGMNITIRLTFNTTTYNTSLSFWNITFTNNPSESLGFNVKSANFLDYYENISRNTLNQSYTTIFPSYTVPYNYTWDNITAKIWWHNQTSAGIILYTFIIKQNATLINGTAYFEASIDTNITLHYRYEDNLSHPIENATINANWAENWSYWFNSSGGEYIIDLHIWGNEGDILYFTVNFSHPNFVSRLHTTEIKILVGTVLILRDGYSEIYHNQTQIVSFSWYTEKGDVISGEKDDPYLHVEAFFDGMPIDDIPGETQWIYDYSQSNSSEPNLFVIVRTQYLPYGDYIGTHNISISVWWRNSTTIYEGQSYVYYFEIKKIPSSLEFYSSTAYYVKNSDDHDYSKILEEFEGYSENIRVRISYLYEKTYADDLDERKSMVPFSWGNLFGYVRDISENVTVIETVQLDSLFDGNSYDGVYEFTFSVKGLKSSNQYELVIFSRTTNVENALIRLRLVILPKWTCMLDIDDLVDQTENSPFTVTGHVFFKNATDQWAANGTRVKIVVSYVNETGMFNRTFYATVDEDGHFELKGVDLIAPNADDYQIVRISVGVSETREHLGVESEVQFLIKKDVVKRYVIPIILGILVILIVPPISKKYLFPYIGAKIAKSRTFKKIRYNPKVDEFIKSFRRNETESDKKGIDALTHLKVPVVDIKDGEIVGKSIGDSTGDKDVKFEVIPLAKEEEKKEKKRRFLDKLREFDKYFVHLQEIFQPIRDKQVLIKGKNDHFYLGSLYENKGNFFDAIIQYSIAQEYARKLGLEEEVLTLESAINRLMIKLPAREQLKFIKKFRLAFEKQRKK